MRKLELISLKIQLDPHFTFNALNVLGYLAKENDTERIDFFINHFSKLLRKQIYGLYKKLYKIKNQQEIIDLQDQNGNSKGTLIKIVMQ